MKYTQKNLKPNPSAVFFIMDICTFAVPVHDLLYFINRYKQVLY